MPRQSTQSAGPAYLPALTGVRALAALMVLVLHASQNFPTLLTGNALVDRGYLGVDLFFILSGFIIAHVYLRDMVPLRARPLRIFLWHRFVRLFPAHAAVLLALVVLIAAVQASGISLNDPRNWNYRDLPWHFLMVHAWGVTGHCWLEQPVVVDQRRVVRLSAVSRGGRIGAGAAEARRAPAHPGRAADRRGPALPRRLEHLGSVARRACADPGRGGIHLRRADLLRRRHRRGEPVTGAVRHVGIRRPRVVLRGCGIAAVRCAADRAAGRHHRRRVGRGAGVRAVFGSGPALWLGEISYSIYVVHFPIILVLRRVAERIAGPAGFASGMARWAMFLVAMAVVIAAAALLFYGVEQPARRRLRNLFGRMDASRPAGVPAHDGVRDRNWLRRNRA